MQDCNNSEKISAQAASLWKKIFPFGNSFFSNLQDPDPEIKKIANILGVFPEAIFDAFFLETLDGVILDCNQKACELYGYSKEEMLQFSVHDLVPEEVAKILPAVIQQELESGSFRGEALGRRKNREIFPVEISTKIFTVQGEKFVAVHVRDISEKKNTENALKESEEMYRSFVRNYEGIAFRGSIDFTPVFFHGKVEKITGYTEKDFTNGKINWDQIIFPEDKILLKDSFEKIRSITGFSCQREYRIIRKDGSVAWLRENIRNICDKDARPVFVEGVLCDLSESKLAEQQLKESEEKYRLISENTSDFIVVMTFALDPVFTYVSPSHKYFGYDQAELIGKAGLEFIHPEDKARLGELLGRYLKEPLTQENPFSQNIAEHVEFRFKDRSGNWRDLESTVNVAGKNLILISKDITKSKSSEEKVSRELNKFKMLYELAVNMSAEKDMDENLEYIVFKTQELLHTDTCQIGLCDRDGNTIHIYTCAGARTDAFKNMKFPSNKGISGMVLSSRKGNIFEDYFNDKRFEHVVDKTVSGEGLVSIMAVPIQTRKKNLGVLYAANRTKTQFTRDDLDTLQLLGNLAAVEIMRRESEQTLKLSYKELKGAQEALVQSEKMAAMGQLAAGISHELFQPLTGIKGFAQAALLDLDEKSPLFEYLTKIIEQSARMETIIGNVRAFARKTEFSLKPVDINGPIDDCLSLLGAQLKSHGIQIKKQLADSLPKVNADANQLQQVFINLITNAKEALEQKGATGEKELFITTRHNRTSGCVEAVFRDTGTGIPKQKLNKIFEPFYTSKPNGKSLGLGLSIVQRIVDNHAGKIAVESAPGKGTSFIVALPVREPPAQENPA